MQVIITVRTCESKRLRRTWTLTLDLKYLPFLVVPYDVLV